jgi:type II secretory pathway component PulM
MPTDPIQGFNAIVQALRQRLAGRREKIETRAADAPAPATPARTEQKASIDDLRIQIAKRLAGLSPEERRSRRGRQVFLESVLVWEFGDEITTDPAFGRLTAEIQQAIEDEAAISTRFGDLLESL